MWLILLSKMPLGDIFCVFDRVEYSNWLDLIRLDFFDQGDINLVEN